MEPADHERGPRPRGPAMEKWFSPRVVTRLPQVVAGSSLLGFGIALMASGNLGFGPWSVLAEGVGEKVGIGLGTADVLLGIPVFLGWLLIREQPGIGTVVAAFGVGFSINLGQTLLGEPDHIVARAALMIVGVIVIGIGVALYLAADLGPGPRDGLMTGLHRRLGWSIRLVRTVIEGFVLVFGFLLGGTVGVGTLLMAFGVGTVIQAALTVFDREGRVMHRVARDGAR